MRIEYLRYTLRTFRWDQIWLPAGFWILFVLLVLFFRTGDNWIDMARGYLGAILPLSAGIMAAYAVLDDPALEIIFSTPVSAGHLLAARLGPMLAVVAAAALTFQIFLLGIGLDLHLLGGLVSLQFSWMVPALTLAALGTFTSLASKQCASGAMLVGAIWIIQLIARGWFLSQDAPSRIMLFMGIFHPQDPRLATNRISLSLLAVALAAVSRRLLKKQERYL